MCNVAIFGTTLQQNLWKYKSPKHPFAAECGHKDAKILAIAFVIRLVGFYVKNISPTIGYTST